MKMDMGNQSKNAHCKKLGICKLANRRGKKFSPHISQPSSLHIAGGGGEPWGGGKESSGFVVEKWEAGWREGGGGIGKLIILTFSIFALKAGVNKASLRCHEALKEPSLSPPLSPPPLFLVFAVPSAMYIHTYIHTGFSQVIKHLPRDATIPFSQCLFYVQSYRYFTDALTLIDSELTDKFKLFVSYP